MQPCNQLWDELEWMGQKNLSRKQRKKNSKIFNGIVNFSVFGAEKGFATFSAIPTNGLQSRNSSISDFLLISNGDLQDPKLSFEQIKFNFRSLAPPPTTCA